MGEIAQSVLIALATICQEARIRNRTKTHGVCICTNMFFIGVRIYPDIHIDRHPAQAIPGVGLATGIANLAGAAALWAGAGESEANEAEHAINAWLRHGEVPDGVPDWMSGAIAVVGRWFGGRLCADDQGCRHYCNKAELMRISRRIPVGAWGVKLYLSVEFLIRYYWPVVDFNVRPPQRLVAPRPGPPGPQPQPHPIPDPDEPHRLEHDSTVSVEPVEVGGQSDGHEAGCSKSPTCACKSDAVEWRVRTALNSGETDPFWMLAKMGALG